MEYIVHDYVERLGESPRVKYLIFRYLIFFLKQFRIGQRSLYAKYQLSPSRRFSRTLTFDGHIDIEL